MLRERSFTALLVFLNSCIFIGLSLLFLWYIPLLISTLEKYRSAWFLIMLVAARIAILASFSVLLYKKWLQQEVSYTSDGFFLFALFFNIFLYGKGLDLFAYLCFGVDEISTALFLIILKLRYLVIILEAIPLLYLGLETIMDFAKIYFTISNDNLIRLFKKGILLGFLGIVSLLIIFAPHSTFIINLFPIIVFGTILGIVIMFLFMYRMKLLSQAHGLIIGIGFILFMLSSVLRSILSTQYNPNPLIFSELVDTFVFFIVFSGFIRPPSYTNKM